MYADGQRALSHFRGVNKQLTLHPLEKSLLALVVIHLAFLPWALGAMRLWAQWISFALAGASFIVALAPRNYTAEHSGGSNFRLMTWPKLSRFPVFWFGLLLLAYVAVQALNPAWQYQTDGKTWWMTALPHTKWLPSGVAVPFERWGPWRMLLIYASAWLMACAIWIGFIRRKTLHLFFITLTINGVLLATLGVAQHLEGNGRLFWLYPSPNPAFFASFIYKNHAAAYLNIILATTCALATLHYTRGLRRLDKSNPAAVLTFCALCIAFSVITSRARGATLFMLAFLTVVAITSIAYYIHTKNRDSPKLSTALFLVIFGVFVTLGVKAFRLNEAWDRIEQGLKRQDFSLEARERATHAALDMLRDNWLLGTGAGSFRFLFPLYQQHHPDVFYYPNTKTRMFWEHAHNDIVQLPIELGTIGTILIIACILSLLRVLITNKFWRNPLSFIITLGLISTTVYSAWDFPFQCPSLLVTWVALWPAITNWAMLPET